MLHEEKSGNPGALIVSHVHQRCQVLPKDLVPGSSPLFLTFFSPENISVEKVT
jgi:hypothetical protein